MAKQPSLLIIRFSAMGDVAMTAPVIQEFNSQYPEVRLTIVSRPLFAPFFKGIPNLQFHALDPKNRHKGFLGLFRLFRELRKNEITAVADLHNNLRSRIIGFLFFFCGIKTVHVDKARAEKKKLTRKEGKILSPLKSMPDRYAEVFSALGYPFTLKHQLPAVSPARLYNTLLEITGTEPALNWIGISPFAQHLQKIYPLDKMESIALQLGKAGYKVYIFGGGPSEKGIAESWAKKGTNIISVIGQLSLAQELDLISNLKLMVSMDSSGMHMASLKGIPVISIWGATHPYAGFLGYGQSIKDAVQLDLYCRPCSVYGNKPCYRGDLACMNNLSETVVMDSIINKLKHG